MKSCFLYFIFSLFLGVGTSLNVFSQGQMVVTLNNNNTETFALSEIRSLKFGTQTMNLYKTNGSISTWNISDIMNYSFVGVTGLDKLETSIGKLAVFPNPAGNRTMISFSTMQNQQISIELLDVQGKKMRDIYTGYHIGQHSYSWQVDVPKGLYLCRVKSENGIVTKPLIIQ
jgi:Secretion system C-terminal sorting domain